MSKSSQAPSPSSAVQNDSPLRFDTTYTLLRNVEKLASTIARHKTGTNCHAAKNSSSASRKNAITPDALSTMPAMNVRQTEP